MNALACYHAINTKLHTRKRTLLGPQEWLQVMAYTTVGQLTDFLKNRYGYSEYITSSSVGEMHRSELEKILHRYIVGEIEKMLHYFSGDYKAFFKILLMKYDIYDLQLVLREIAREENMLGIDTHFVHSKKYSPLDYNRILACTTVNQFIEVLKDTPYYDTLKTITQEDAIQREFHMEMKLYMLYYKVLMEKAEKLDKRDTEIVKLLIGKKIDLLNIQWIYRATKYYDISKEEILIYSLTGGNIHYKGLKKLIYTKSLDEFKELANKCLHEQLFNENEKDSFLVRQMDEIMYKLIKKVKDQNTIAIPLEYIYGLEIEIDDLIAVTEGIRYGLSQDEMEKYLVVTI